MDQAAQAYIDGIAPEHRPLFERLRRLIETEFPRATLALSYKMPTFTAGSRRLYVGAWKHGISLYGWRQGGIDGFLARHPKLRTSKGTVQLTPDEAAGIPDGELEELVHAALDA